MYSNNNGGIAALDYAITGVHGSEYVIAAYSRLSEQDDKNDVSNSIKNQIAMIRNYVDSNTEFANAKIVDYIDDGISGSHTDRKAYQRLMVDIKRGAVHCIIVKDLSRIGRNMIDVDDLLMNYLVTQGTRFIAINNGYDSLKSPLSNLELAVINLANQHYNRDLAEKSRASVLVKKKRGEYLSTWAIFGYKKSATERNKLAIDEESACYVRLMFSLAADGNNYSKIAIILNAQGIPTPSQYSKSKSGNNRIWRTADPDYCFWDNALVGNILKDLRYTGTAVSNVYKLKQPGSGSRVSVKRPQEEWIIIPDAHEAIISKSEFDKAHAAIQREKLSDVPLDHIFHKKVKCPACNHTLKRSGPVRPYFRCRTPYYTKHYDCPDCYIRQPDLEKIVLESVKVHVARLVDHEDLKLAALQRGGVSKCEIETKIKTEQRALRVLSESVTKNITALVSGKISQDIFLSKKEIINNTIAHKNEELAKLYEQFRTISNGKSAVEERLSVLHPILTIDRLDRDVVDLLVDKILVHGAKEIEIVWND
jgi:DNA invertase Pin-like site-specific DNA recombinase